MIGTTNTVSYTDDSANFISGTTPNYFGNTFYSNEPLITGIGNLNTYNKLTLTYITDYK